MPREKIPTFEELYARLDATVGRLEQGGLSLEEAIALYEEGMIVARRCQEQLDQAEQKIIRLKESFANVAPVRPPDAAPRNGSEERLDESRSDDDPFA